MNVKETSMILQVLSVAYPAFYRSKDPVDLKAAVVLWHEMFREDDYEDVVAAVKAYIASDTKGFPPIIGTIKNSLVVQREGSYMTELEAWQRIREAVADSGYHSVSSFNALPPILQKLVGGPSQLREWAMLEGDSFSTVVASNVMRSYKNLCEREQYEAALPQDVKERLMAMTGNKMIGGSR